MRPAVHFGWACKEVEGNRGEEWDRRGSKRGGWRSAGYGEFVCLGGHRLGYSLKLYPSSRYNERMDAWKLGAIVWFLGPEREREKDRQTDVGQKALRSSSKSYWRDELIINLYWYFLQFFCHELPASWCMHRHRFKYWKWYNMHRLAIHFLYLRFESTQNISVGNSL